MPSKTFTRHVNTKSHENVAKQHTAKYREDVGDEPKEHMLLFSFFFFNLSRFPLQIKKNTLKILYSSTSVWNWMRFEWNGCCRPDYNTKCMPIIRLFNIFWLFFVFSMLWFIYHTIITSYVVIQLHSLIKWEINCMGFRAWPLSVSFVRLWCEQKGSLYMYDSLAILAPFPYINLRKWMLFNNMYLLYIHEFRGNQGFCSGVKKR